MPTCAAYHCCATLRNGARHIVTPYTRGVLDLIPLVQAATEYGVDRATIYRYLKAGRLKRYKKGMDRRTYIDRAELKKILRPRIVRLT